jgi:hypothetical protein
MQQSTKLLQILISSASYCMIYNWRQSVPLHNTQNHRLNWAGMHQVNVAKHKIVANFDFISELLHDL